MKIVFCHLCDYLLCSEQIIMYFMYRCICYEMKKAQWIFCNCGNYIIFARGYSTYNSTSWFGLATLLVATPSFVPDFASASVPDFPSSEPTANRWLVWGMGPRNSTRKDYTSCGGWGWITGKFLKLCISVKPAIQGIYFSGGNCNK